MNCLLGTSMDRERLWMVLDKSRLAAWEFRKADPALTTSDLPPGIVVTSGPAGSGLFEDDSGLWMNGELFYRSSDGWMCRYNPDTHFYRRLYQCPSSKAAPYTVVTNHGRPILVSYFRGDRHGPSQELMAWDLESNARASGRWVENLRLARVSQYDRTDCIVASPDGTWIAQAEAGNTIGIWDVRQERRTAQLEGHGSFLWGFAFAPDSRLLATGSYEPAVRLWNVQTGRQSGSPLRGSYSGVTQTAFSADGRSLLSNEENLVRIHHVGSGQEMIVLEDRTLIMNGERPQTIDAGMLFWIGTGGKGRPAYLPLPSCAEIDMQFLKSHRAP